MVVKKIIVLKEAKMFRRCSKNDGMTDFLVFMLITVVALPILGTYWMFKGDSDTKRIAGIVVLVLCFIGMIFSAGT